MNMHTFSDLKKLAKKNDVSGSREIKIALLSDSSSQFLCQALKGTGAANNVNYNIWEADYDQISMQVMDPESELYAFNPEYIVLIRSSEHLLKDFYKSSVEEQARFCDKQLNYLESLFREISSRLKAKIITNTYFEINDAVFGNYANKVVPSFIYQTRKLNVELMQQAQHSKNLFLLDLAAITGQPGYANTFDAKLYLNGDMVFNLEALPVIAYHIHTIIQAIGGRFIKCVILDLDNTLWGGVIGDDGMEGIRIGDLGIGKAYSELQRFFRQLKNRGIILCVCSKNTESIAKEPFEKHPDMELRLTDIAMFVANWENKVDNIRHIQKVLQIGFDSMVFVDDNPFEREMVRSAIPDLTIPDLPEDPADYLSYLRSLNLFETASFTEEDLVRTTQYQQEAERSNFQKSFANETEFLASLDMTSEVAAFNSFTIPRIAQLTQRSNQFNLRTVRYTESDIQKIATSDEYQTFSFTLKDKFGDHGLISAIILRKADKETLFIDTWIMSCRVLKREMEQFALFSIAEYAASKGFSKLVGEYLPTPKNGIVKDHYLNLGFIPAGDKWLLQINANKVSNSTHIVKK